jgi:hypothetical protein
MVKGTAIVSVALLAVSFVRTTLATHTWPNYVMDELEHLLVDNGGFNDAGVLKAITPCTNYVSGPSTAGRITAAEWIRVTFRMYLFLVESPVLLTVFFGGGRLDDFVTANVSAGTGGLDASIGFEGTRAENSGLYLNNTFGFFAPYFNKYVSSRPSNLYP